ncbi:MAG TPA: hypothetical protein VH062_00835 [Polyangiaceae bacterium]|jgi:hypothetical protein|nr:hypothetical protein [Polyangiaceae bacterium]
MTDANEIRMPEEPSRLVAHSAVEVLMTLQRSQGDSRPLLTGRCTTHHLRPNGVIVVVRPQLVAKGPTPVKRADAVHVRLKRSQNETMDVDGVVSWLRARAFLPSGLAVSLIGITFDGDPDERVFEVTEFLSRQSLTPPE